MSLIATASVKCLVKLEKLISTESELFNKIPFSAKLKLQYLKIDLCALVRVIAKFLLKAKDHPRLKENRASSVPIADIYPLILKEKSPLNFIIALLG